MNEELDPGHRFESMEFLLHHASTGKLISHPITAGHELPRRLSDLFGTTLHPQAGSPIAIGIMNLLKLLCSLFQYSKSILNFYPDPSSYPAFTVVPRSRSFTRQDCIEFSQFLNGRHKDYERSESSEKDSELSVICVPVNSCASGLANSFPWAQLAAAFAGFVVVGGGLCLVLARVPSVIATLGSAGVLGSSFGVYI